MTTPAPTRQPATKLSDREREVLTLIVEGHSNGMIGRRLFLSEDTVKTHIRRIFKKLGAENRTQAATMAVVWQLVPRRHVKRLPDRACEAQ